ncbi:transmembrane 7 superfamily member 3 [Nilaparvata lugens]|uniref:transmembrane 7 superfamily member 3 n=1 Tax=Nilaparvata lugens TaxID=108931 RepID=UPI00193D0B4B|nr:transmembrane 7 superfamily member 3 [Nilaparvata lugens]
MNCYSFSIFRLCVLIAFISSSINFENVAGILNGNDSSVINNLNKVTTIRMPLASVKLKSSGEVLVQNINVVSPFTTAVLNITNIESDVNFFVTEVHSHLHNITLGYHVELVPHTYIVGTNIGLVTVRNGASNVQLYLQNFNLVEVTAMITIIGYNKFAPIPGGCNMEFPVPISPFLMVTETDSMIIVDSQPAADAMIPQYQCLAPLRYDIYQMYMPEKDLSVDTYFNSMKKMMTVNDIKTNGRKVSPSLLGSVMQRVYSAYTGTGSVYAVIVSSGFDRESAYVPAQTYACGSAENGNSKCALLSSSSKSSLLMLIVFCAGLALCYTGHAYFTLELFIFGTLTSTLIFDVLLTWIFPNQGVLFLSALTGTAFGIVWCLLWIILGIPILSVLLPVLTCGYLCTATLFYFLADYIETLQEVQEIDINYWLAILCGTLSFTIFLLLKPCEASIISSAFVGSYMIIFPIDNYLGSNLKFILVNTIRRATVDGFSSAITSPPFQYSDFILLITWFAQTGFGYAVQRVSLVGRPPFPHNRKLLRNASTPDERSPLLRPGAVSNVYVSSATNELVQPHTT